MTTTNAARLLRELEKIDRPGTFCVNGVLPSIPPGLVVNGVGPVPLPLEKKKALSLKKVARQAPYGKGTRTLVDTEVRRVWEIDADQVNLTNPEWGAAVSQAVETTQEALGLQNRKLRAQLYKALLYETGSFFLSHRDGEKLDRMVATLVITLPSKHGGGQLAVGHEGRECVVDFSKKSEFSTQFAAFYADCAHEIRPVTSGFRLALIYNLTLEKSKQPITAPTSSQHIKAISKQLCAWSRQFPVLRDESTASSPKKIAVLLEHQYTQSGLTIDALKGIDRARANVLFAAAEEGNCDASLALVTHWMHGSAEPSGIHHGYGRRWEYAPRDDDASDHDMGEVYESSLTAACFSDAEGKRLAYGTIPLDEKEVVSRYPMTEALPDEEDFEGYTGNAGMTLDRWYHRAAVLIWPKELRFDVLCGAGVEAATGGLENSVKKWKRAKKVQRANLKQYCREFARRILAIWPERNHLGDHSTRYAYQNYLARRSDEKPSRPLLDVIAELDDPFLVTEWLRHVLMKDVAVDPGSTLGDVCERHGWSTFKGELTELFNNTTNETMERHARLLVDWCLRNDSLEERKSLCVSLADRMLSALERWVPVTSDWRAKQVNCSDLLSLFTQSLIVLHEGRLLERFVSHVLDRSDIFDLSTVQVPAAFSAWKSG
ncbi:MAG: 2OG-Fe(II) oxygenase [Planctomycetota bacterium]